MPTPIALLHSCSFNIFQYILVSKLLGKTSDAWPLFAKHPVYYSKINRFNPEFCIYVC